MAWHFTQPFVMKTSLPSLGFPGVMKAASFGPLAFVLMYSRRSIISAPSKVGHFIPSLTIWAIMTGPWFQIISLK